MCKMRTIVGTSVLGSLSRDPSSWLAGKRNRPTSKFYLTTVWPTLIGNLIVAKKTSFHVEKAERQAQILTSRVQCELITSELS